MTLSNTAHIAFLLFDGFPLARTGLVSDQPLAVHWCYQAAFDNEFPTYHASEQVTEQHQGYITAAGAAGGF